MPLIRFEVWLVLGGFALVVAYKMLIGKINFKGLLDDKVTGGTSPGRVQLLVLTLTGAGYYLLLAAEQADSGSLPTVPEEVLLLVGGSNLVYLGAKARSHLFRLIEEK
jgi:hypothetical protein